MTISKLLMGKQRVDTHFADLDTNDKAANLHADDIASPLLDSYTLHITEDEAAPEKEPYISPCTIDDLPFEILQTIFMEACASEYIWISSESSPFAHIPTDDHTSEDPLPFDVPDDPSCEPFQMSLLRVSSRWRAVGCATSSIWGRVVLTLSRVGPFPNPEDMSCPARRRLDRVLGYAKGAGMHAVCQGWMGNAYTASLCARLFRTSNQWDTAHLHLNGLPTIRLMDALKGELALLNLLDVHLNPLWPPAEGEEICEAFCVAPRLTDVRSTYIHWEMQFPWEQLIAFTGKVSFDNHAQYLRRSLERRAQKLEVLSVNISSPWPLLSLEAEVDLTLSGVLPSVRSLNLNDEHTPTIFTCPSLAHLTIHPHEEFNFTPLPQAVSMLERSCCSLTSFSMYRLRPMEADLVHFRRVLLLSPELEFLSIYVDRRESRRVNRVLRLMLEFMKGFNNELRKLRYLMIETVARNTPTSYVPDQGALPGVLPRIEDETFDMLRALFAAYLPASSVGDRTCSSQGLAGVFTCPYNLELNSVMNTAAFTELENCDKGTLAVVLKFSQFEGSELLGLYAGPEVSSSGGVSFA